MPKIKIIPPLIAHRGVRSLAPENTLAAFLKVKALKIKWVELDVRFTACGEAVVFHDELLDRTTNYTGKLLDFTWDALKNVDAGSKFHPQFSTEKISTLAQVLLALDKENIAVNIEIKWIKDLEEKMAQKILNVLAEVSFSQPFFISSFSRKILQYIRQQNDTVIIAFLVDDWQKDFKNFCDEIHAAALCINYRSLNRARIEQIKKTPLSLFAYTVNNSMVAKKLFKEGVDAIFTDYPQDLIHIIPR